MEKIARFYKEHKFLSNFYPHRPNGGTYNNPVVVMYNGLQFNSVESAYMAAKTLDPELQKQIQKMSPFQSKAFSKLGGIPVRDDWEDVKISIMTDLVGQKFKNSPQLKKMLLGTGGCIIEEGNLHEDTFWGINLETGKGNNHLGQILMRLREEIRGQSKRNECKVSKSDNNGPSSSPS